MKKIFKTYYLAIISCLAVLSASAKDGVAVVIDAVSYEKARTELDGYVHALEKNRIIKYILWLTNGRCQIVYAHVLSVCMKRNAMP